MSSNRYGLIGEKLGHSFSAVIHPKLADILREESKLDVEGLIQEAFESLETIKL